MGFCERVSLIVAFQIVRCSKSGFGYFGFESVVFFAALASLKQTLAPIGVWSDEIGPGEAKATSFTEFLQAEEIRMKPQKTKMKPEISGKARKIPDFPRKKSGKSKIFRKSGRKRVA